MTFAPAGGHTRNSPTSASPEMMMMFWMPNPFGSASLGAEAKEIEWEAFGTT